MAIEESLTLDRFGGLHTGRNQPTIARSELYASKSLIHLERPRLRGFRVDMAPIVKPECHIAILLNLENHNIVAQSVNRSRRDEYGIARLWGNAHKVFCNGSVAQRLSQNVSSGARFQAGINLAPFLSFNYHPRFGLCRIAGWIQLRGIVSGMHVHRKHLVRV